jgi:hypothetical protein
MNQTLRPAALALILAPALLLGACQTTANAPAAPNPPAFVEAACGGCHAVEPPFLSPNPRAPAFATVANRAGVTDDTLGQWLTDAHNYPEDMDFDLTAEQVVQIADYLVTLRRSDYAPVE